MVKASNKTRPQACQIQKKKLLPMSNEQVQNNMPARELHTANQNSVNTNYKKTSSIMSRVRGLAKEIIIVQSGQACKNGQKLPINHCQ